MEVHNDPDAAPSDGPNMVHLENLEQILIELIELDEVSKKYERNI
jgi:2-dehydro-3-deoxyphosphooctonate aldolase (KDO 8-P synthase)